MSLDPIQFNPGERERLTIVAKKFSGKRGKRRAAGKVNPFEEVKENFSEEGKALHLIFNISKIILIGGATFVGACIGALALAAELKLAGTTGSPNLFLLLSESGVGAILGEEIVRRASRVKDDED